MMNEEAKRQEPISPGPVHADRPAGGSSARAGSRPIRRAASANARRLNALRHGLLSDEPVVIAGAETVADYRKVRRRILHDLHLVGAMELALGEQIVRTWWRLRRVPLYEAAVLSEEMRRVDQEVAAEIGKEPAKHERKINPWHPLAEIGRATLKGSLELLKRMPRMWPGAPVKPQRALDLLFFVAQVAKVSLDETVLFGVPDDPVLRSAHRWSVGNVRDAMTSIALKADCDPAGLEVRAQFRARQMLMWSDAEAEPLRAKRQERQRLHLLPQQPVLDRIVRYEAHLNRLLWKYQTQLDVAQARRRGESTPLARLDIQGLPDA
jgi:hypothetical protein